LAFILLQSLLIGKTVQKFWPSIGHPLSFFW
jgi:hypothetical protein